MPSSHFAWNLKHAIVHWVGIGTEQNIFCDFELFTEPVSLNLLASLLRFWQKAQVCLETYLKFASCFHIQFSAFYVHIVHIHNSRF